MGLRKILTTADPALHKVCKPVTAFDEKLHKLLDDMRDTLIDSNGVGLAAPQVGILRRIFLVDVGMEENEIVEFINPEILETDGEQVGPEGCLSVPGKYGLVTRPYYVKVKALNENMEEVIYEGEELLARAFCHEIDHLDGHFRGRSSGRSVLRLLLRTIRRSGPGHGPLRSRAASPDRTYREHSGSPQAQPVRRRFPGSQD